MKQSEQFFRLSDLAGYETKPILLYYGLNQAARGLIAAAARPNEPWELNAHGLTCPNLNEARTIGDVTVVDQGSGKSFQMLAKYTWCPTLPVKVQLRELWASLPEGATVPLQGSHDICMALRLFASTQHLGSNGTTLAYPKAAASLFGLPRHRSVDELRQVLRERYPSMRRFSPLVAEDGRVHTLINAWSDRGTISLVAESDVQTGYIDNVMITSCGPEIYSDRNALSKSTWVIPTLAGNDEPLKPIVTWWAVLFTLSMLARYQPSSWTKMLDIDSSPDAPAVEYLLDEAHRVCVNLILDAFAIVERAAFFEDEQSE
ncbi:hypothetical protein GCM10010464_35970 [Pseudonocardia yunnanensis]